MSTSERNLRPIESRILAMLGEGMGAGEIGKKFNRSEEFVERVVDLTAIPREKRDRSAGLRPIERRILDLRAEGVGHDEIGRRFKRSGRSIRQIEGLAHYRKGVGMMTAAADELRAGTGEEVR